MKVNVIRLAKVVAQLLAAAPTIIAAIKPVVRGLKGDAKAPPAHAKVSDRAEPIPESVAPQSMEDRGDVTAS